MPAGLTTQFAQAAKVFEGYTDPTTGARVLKVVPKNMPEYRPGLLHTLYHQCYGFLDGGRKLLLRDGTRYSGWGAPTTYVLDLYTGLVSKPFPEGYSLVEVTGDTRIALLTRESKEGDVAVLWDIDGHKELTHLPIEKGWRLPGFAKLSDGRRAVATQTRGRHYMEHVVSRMFLLEPGAQPKLILEADAAYCNHMQGCPTDPDLLAYDRWCSPLRDVPQVIHVMSVDGRFHQSAALDDHAPKPVSMYGVRDHYVWTPDGRRIVSYLNPDRLTPEDVMRSDFDHFKIRWILSALDWRTGEDFFAFYPAGRWGCHPQVTRDSKYILSAGGPGFDFLYAVDLQKLRDGWNERLICGYPKTVSKGINAEPFPQPTPLVDGSGILFNAGWPGEEHGVYLVEWNG